MKHHLQAILVVLAILIVALVIVELTIPHSPTNLAVFWMSELDAATQQLSRAQTPVEVFSAVLRATAFVALPLGYALFIAIALLTIAMRILDLILSAVIRYYTRKALR